MHLRGQETITSDTWCISCFCFFLPLQIWSQATLDSLKSLNYVPHLWVTMWKYSTALIEMSFILILFHFFVLRVNICLSVSLSSVGNKRKQKMYCNIIATEIINDGTFSLIWWKPIPLHSSLSRLLFLSFPFHSVLDSIYLDRRKFANVWLVLFSSSVVPFYVKQISINFTFQCHASTRVSERNKEQTSLNTEMRVRALYAATNYCFYLLFYDFNQK